MGAVEIQRQFLLISLRVVVNESEEISNE